jgi:hypothetical protein
MLIYLVSSLASSQNESILSKVVGPEIYESLKTAAGAQVVIEPPSQAVDNASQTSISELGEAISVGLGVFGVFCIDSSRSGRGHAVHDVWEQLLSAQDRSRDLGSFVKD